MRHYSIRPVNTITASLIILVLAAMIIPTTGTASATNSVNKVQSGLVVSDSLTTGNISSWDFGGTATSHNYYEDTQGLHIGVRSPSDGQWVNYYAHLSQPNARLFHTTITIPDTTVADGVSNIGLYVEGSDYIPHVGCEAYADSTGYYWDVEQSSDAGQTYNILYISQPNSLPQTQDCTVITNGSNYLKVYIGNNLVFSSTTMNLGMSGPFIAFVQDDTSSSSSMHYATYRDYYVASDEKIKVTNNPANAATVSLVDSSGTTLVKSSSISSGTATLNVGKYHFPISGTINVYDNNNNVIASSPASVYGGDVYSVNISSTAPQSPTNLSATAISSSQVNLSWSAPSDNGGSAITGYMIERSQDNGNTWSTIVSNTGSTSTTYSNVGLAASTSYAYRVSAINSVGTSIPSGTASATTSAALTVPQPPTNLSATAVSSSQINLSWNAPSNNGGSPITGYKINRSDDGGTTWITLVQNTQSTGTTYSDTGLSPSTTHSYRVFAINGIGTSPSSNTAIATTIAQVHTITRAQSGLVASDPLNNETKTQQEIFANQQYWKDGGDAMAENAPYEYSKDSQGLHIGVQAPANGTWAGMYSVTPNTNAMLFHSVITTPVNFIPYQWYENGMYVQTAASQNVNYVTCVAATSQWGLDWLVVSTTGNVNQATQFNVLYADPSSNQPLTRDCTIITNGNNYLKVYLDGTMVYNNSTMNLQMPGPFNAFLEPQSSYPGKMLDGIYKDYYATTDENIKITNNPSNAARVDLVDTSGTVIASSPVSSGTGTINVGSYHFPLAGTIKVYDGSNNVIASTSSMVNIFGGDVYSYN